MSKSIIQVNNLENASAALTQVQNTTALDLEGDQVNLILRIIDGTGSMRPYTHEMIEAAKLNVKALIDAKGCPEMLMSTWVFNDNGLVVVDSFVPLVDVTPLDQNSYQPQSGTNLYDTVYLALTDETAGIIKYAQSLKNQGIRVKVTVLVLSDGEDTSSRISPQQIKDIVAKYEGYYFVFMAFGTGFAQSVADDMGFPNVLEADSADEHALRKIMGEFSKSQVHASQTTVAGNAFFTPAP